MTEFLVLILLLAVGIAGVVYYVHTRMNVSRADAQAAVDNLKTQVSETKATVQASVDEFKDHVNTTVVEFKDHVNSVLKK